MQFHFRRVRFRLLHGYSIFNMDSAFMRLISSQQAPPFLCSRLGYPLEYPCVPVLQQKWLFMTKTHQLCRWHAFADASALERAATAKILQSAQHAIARAGRFHLVLAGGGTPRRIYHALSQSGAEWSRWHIYFGDERCLPPDDTERNSHMAADAWLDHVSIPPSQIHTIPAESGAAAAASSYASSLAGLGDFDLVLLGLGEDGHTASLFPGHEWGTETDAPDVLPVFNAPKPPAERVSLSAHRLAATRLTIFLVSGPGKQSAVAAWRAGMPIPAAAIAPVAGVDVFFDFMLPDQ
jgi:6-phosphogluconolactonase